MLNREDWLMIREMREKGCYLREIAERAGCSERTVRRALKRGGPPPKRRSGVRTSTRAWWALSGAVSRVWSGSGVRSTSPAMCSRTRPHATRQP